MDSKKVKLILDKAVQDKTFAAKLQTNFNATVSSFSLSREEMTAVRDGLNSLISRGVVIDNGSGM